MAIFYKTFSEMNIVLVSGCCQKLSFWLIIATSILLCTEAKKHVKIRNFYCDNLDEKFGQFSQCNVKAIRRDLSEINVYFKLHKIMNNGLLLNLLLKKRGNSRIPILNITFDCCKFMENRGKYMVPNLFFKVMGFEDHSNMNHTCPYKEDIYLKGYRFDEQNISLLPIPFGEYSFVLNWIYLKKLVARNKISFEFYEKDEHPNRKVNAVTFL